MKCYKCGKEYLRPHENVRGILIDPESQEVHKCNPDVKIVPDGIWKGYTFKEMANLVASRNGWTKKGDITKIGQN
jgi:hypothetical protein